MGFDVELEVCKGSKIRLAWGIIGLMGWDSGDLVEGLDGSYRGSKGLWKPTIGMIREYYFESVLTLITE